jgi:hypothetical protein
MESRNLVDDLVTRILQGPADTTPTMSIAQALIEDQISDEDLEKLNLTSTFPPNQYPPSGQQGYNSQEAMIHFIEKIGPYLSDKTLYDLTEKLIAIEIDTSSEQTFRNSRLAKFFLRYEFERHGGLDPQGHLPAATAAHLNEAVLPRLRSDIMHDKDPQQDAKNFQTFVTFNILNLNSSPNNVYYDEVKSSTSNDLDLPTNSQNPQTLYRELNIQSVVTTPKPTRTAPQIPKPQRPQVGTPVPQQTPNLTASQSPTRPTTNSPTSKQAAQTSPPSRPSLSSKEINVAPPRPRAGLGESGLFKSSSSKQQVDSAPKTPQRPSNKPGSTGGSGGGSG